MIPFVVLFLMTGLSMQPVQPDSVSLEYCYEKAHENYPTAKNIELQKRITDLNVRIANTGYYPDISLGGRVSYQSEVTEFSIPGSGVSPSVSKDQYAASVDVSQPIFNGGSVGIRKKLERAKGRQEINATRIELHHIRAQVDQVYFGILLSQQQSKNIDLLMESLREQMSTVRSRVNNGVLLASQLHILEAELLKAQQDSVDAYSNTKAGYLVLSEIIGEEVDVQATLSLPATEVSYQNMQPQRAEYDLFESTRKTIEQQKKLAEAKALPGISAFGTAAYGRPGLNFLNDDFHDYYIVGVRLRWNIKDAVNTGRESEVLKIQQQKVAQNQQAFSRQLNATLDRISERIASIRENMERDRQIIELRKQIVKESASELKNGVITATEYVTELNRASQAQLSLFINRIQLAKAQTEYKTALGITKEKGWE